MTTLPPNADELVSAYLDGEAAPDEVELVESNDELLARVASMRAVSQRLGVPISPATEVREMHLASALAAFDELMLGGDSDNAGVVDTADSNSPDAAPVAAPVSSLDHARQRRRPRRLNGLIAAAAAALLLFVGITALTVTRTNDGFDTAAEDVGQLKDSASLDDAAGADTADTADAADTFSADAMADDAANATMAAPAEEESAAADDAAGAMMAEAPAAEAAMADSEVDESFAARAISPTDEAIFFGSFPNADALDDFLVAEFPIDDLRDRAAGETAGLVPSCQANVGELADATSSTLVGTAEIDGVFTEVHLRPDASAMLLVRAIDCTVVDEIALSDS